MTKWPWMKKFDEQIWVDIKINKNINSGRGSEEQIWEYKYWSIKCKHHHLQEEMSREKYDKVKKLKEI